jgi:hypothetical protein
MILTERILDRGRVTPIPPVLRPCETELEKSLPIEAARDARSGEANDLDTSVVFAGECVDLIRNVKPAAAILASIVHEAETSLRSKLPLAP